VIGLRRALWALGVAGLVAGAVPLRAVRDDGHVLVEISDDGVGGADPSRGSGLNGLADRLYAVGGRLEVMDGRGGGTVVRADIPC
jgi:signal transduction histidine kinase